MSGDTGIIFYKYTPKKYAILTVKYDNNKPNQTFQATEYCDDIVLTDKVIVVKNSNNYTIKLSGHSVSCNCTKIN